MVTTFSIASAAGTWAFNSRLTASSRTRLRTMSISVSSVLGVGRTMMLKRRLRAADMSLTPRSRVLAVAITENPLAAGTSVASSGTEMRFSERSEISASCTSDGAAGDFLEAGQGARLHRAEDGALDQRCMAGPAGDQHRVVPGIANLLLGRAGRALHDLGRIAVDRGGEMLGEPRLGRARFAEQEQGAVGDERRDGDLDQPLVADVLGRDLQRAALPPQM